MSFEVGTVVEEAWDRFATAAGLVLFLAFAVVGVAQAVATQDLVRALLEEIREPVLEAVREENPEMEAEIAESFDAALADLPLAMELSPGVATLVWLVGFVVTAVLTVVAVDAFANDRDRISGIEVDGLGGKTGHLVVGGLVYAIAVFVGLLLFVLPGLLVLLFLAFFPAAIVVEDRGFWSAFGRSVDVVRNNVVDVLLVVVLTIAAFFVLGFVGGLLAVALSGAAGAILEQLLGTVATVFTLALLTRAFLAGRAAADAPEGEVEPDEGAAEPDDGEIHEDW